jgi:hypothetical protein
MFKYHEERGTISGMSPADLTDEQFEEQLRAAVQGWAEADREQALKELRQAATSPQLDSDEKVVGPPMYEHVTDGTAVAASTRLKANPATSAVASAPLVGDE